MPYINRDKNEQFELLKEIVDESLSYIYVCDTKTHELLYVNERMSELTGKPVCEACKNTCYKYIKGLDKPCNPCYIDSTGKNEYKVRTYYSEASNKSYVSRGKIIDWYGREALIEYLTDETDRINSQKTIEDMLNNIPGGVGIYHYYPNGMLEQVYLNDGYYSLIGTTREGRERFKGFSVLKAIHNDDLNKLLSVVKKGINSNEEISIDIRILTASGDYKWFNIKASIASKSIDKIVLYAFYSDIDELKKTELNLESSRKAINIASKTRDLAFWLFYIDERKIEHNYIDSSPLGYNKVINNVPDCLINSGDIYPTDEKLLLKMYDDIFNGKKESECIVRILNKNNNKYEWQRMIYTVLDKSMYGKNVAIGFSANAETEQENIQRYNNELRLRHEIVKNSLFYYQLNLTKEIFEEYYSNLDDSVVIQPGTRISKKIREQLLVNVYKEDRDLVINNLFKDSIQKMYNNGITSNELVYRRYTKKEGLIWVKSFVNILENPNNHELIAFIYCHNIDNEKKKQLAIDMVVENEIDSIMILNILTGKARTVKMKESYGNLEENKYFNFDEKMKELISTESHPDDVLLCKNYFSQDKIIKSLDKDSVSIITYRIINNGEILRKKVRSFYLDDSKTDIVVVRQDITDLYAIEQEQKRILQEARDKANEANQAKSEFLSRMSHDIRTPLTTIIALSSKEMLQGINDEQMSEYLNKINISSNFLLGLVNDVLDMSKIESKKIVLSKEPYSYKEFKNTIETIISNECNKKGIEFVMETDEFHKECIVTDKIRFNQIIINLLSNAVKFTPSGGKIEFLIKNQGYDGVKFKKRFIVKDTGIGMSEDFLPHCFETFTQEKQKSYVTVAQGTGLGLPIVKQIVEIMGGSITVESKLGKGTTFIVDLCLEETDNPNTYEEISKKNIDESILKGLNVLLCEDNVMNSEIICNILNNKGLTVTQAFDGKDGLDKFSNSKENYYDLILMDIRMPVMDGLETTRIIRSLSRSDAKSIPIIALTADAFTEDYQIAKDSGMNDHLIKPINTTKLFSTITKWVKSR